MFWKTLAKRFRKHSSVLGYEVLNEPWAGNIFQDMSLLLPGVAGGRNLEPVRLPLPLVVLGSIIIIAVTVAIKLEDTSDG